MSEQDKLLLATLQLQIMDVLWKLNEATVAEVRAELEAQGKDLAYTTVATMLTKMEKKGVVKHRSDGRVLKYKPAVARGKVAEAMTGELVAGVFGGSPVDLVGHLLDSSEIKVEELARIKELIRRKENEISNSRLPKKVEPAQEEGDLDDA